MITFEAIPLEKYSSLHKISPFHWLGLKSRKLPAMKVFFNFGLRPLLQKKEALLAFNVRDTDSVISTDAVDFSIRHLTRWRLYLSQFDSFDDFIQKKLNRRLQKKYEETQAVFYNYGASMSLIDGDWSEHAEHVYNLYLNVAQKHGAILYDLNFFRCIAKRDEYKLLCFWYQGSMFSALIMVDEEPIFHSMLCCLDYKHSSKTRAYSKMHYEIIRLAIESKKHTIVDIGITSDKAKAVMGYQPIEVCMDISSENYFIKKLLRALSFIFTANISEEGKLKLKRNPSR